jgi:transposase
MTVGCEDITDTPTIHLALDLDRRWWTVVFVLPWDRAARLYRIAGGDREALLPLIERQRNKLDEEEARIVGCYEAGRDGFWLDRWLKAHGVDNRILDSASLEVPRRRQRRGASRPADQQGRQPKSTHLGDRMRLDVGLPSARQRAQPMVAAALRRWRQATA